MINDLAARGLTLLEFAAAAGVSYDGLRSWFYREGATTARETIERLATTLGISLELAIAEAGGRTAEQVQGEKARLALQASADSRRRSPEKFRQAHERGTAKLRTQWEVKRQRRRKRSPEQLAPMLAAAHRNARTTRMRAVQALLLHKRRVRDTTPERLSALQRRVADRLHASPSVIAEYWRPWLKRWGLHLKIGRPRLEERHRRIDALLAQGFGWTRIHNELKHLEGSGLPSEASVKRGYYSARVRGP